MLEDFLKAEDVFNIIQNTPLEQPSQRLMDGFLNTASAVRSEVNGSRFIIRDAAGDDRVLIGFQRNGF